jgi:hypothetical protein
LEHSLNVYDELIKETEALIYPIETLTIVSLFHDLCKVGFYTVEMRNAKNESGQWVKVPYYAVDDKFPIGHSEKSVIMLLDCIKLTNDEMLAINSHMGGFDERKNVISNAFSQCKLGVFLHIADLKATYLREVKI